MRIARAVIAPDAATHRVKGRVDRSDGFPPRRAGGCRHGGAPFFAWPSGRAGSVLLPVSMRFSRSRGEKEEYPSHIPQEKTGKSKGVLEKIFENFFEPDNGPVDTLSDRRFADAFGGCNLNGGHFVKDRGKQPAPLGFRELCQRFFQ